MIDRAVTRSYTARTESNGKCSTNPHIFSTFTTYAQLVELLSLWYKFERLNNIETTLVINTTKKSPALSLQSFSN